MMPFMSGSHKYERPYGHMISTDGTAARYLPVIKAVEQAYIGVPLGIIFRCHALNISFTVIAISNIVFLIEIRQRLLFPARYTQCPVSHDALSIYKVSQHFFYTPLPFCVFIVGFLLIQLFAESIHLLPLFNKLLNYIWAGDQVDIFLMVIGIFIRFGNILIPV